MAQIDAKLRERESPETPIFTVFASLRKGAQNAFFGL